MSTAADDSHDENYISMAPSAAIRVKSHWTGKSAVTCVQVETCTSNMYWTCCNMECCALVNMSQKAPAQQLEFVNKHSMCSGKFKLATFQSLPHV